MEQRKSTSPIRLRYKSKTLTLSDLDENLGKLPPQALDLEEAVLGALMLEKDALSTVIDILKPDTFYKDAHQEIYRLGEANTKIAINLEGLSYGVVHPLAIKIGEENTIWI